MAAQKFRVIFTQSAWNDIEEIVAYWTSRDQPERGAQYAQDLPSEAIRQLSDPGTARAGRHFGTPPTRRPKSSLSSSAPIASST
jgi:plasmid stabilization system protein ParE